VIWSVQIIWRRRPNDSEKPSPEGEGFCGGMFYLSSGIIGFTRRREQDVCLAFWLEEVVG
jgi:hypothetical protein